MGGWGEGNWDNCGTGVRASILKPTPFIYLTSEKRTHSYTRSSEMFGPIHILPFDFLYPFVADN